MHNYVIKNVRLLNSFNFVVLLIILLFFWFNSTLKIKNHFIKFDADFDIFHNNCFCNELITVNIIWLLKLKCFFQYCFDILVVYSIVLIPFPPFVSINILLLFKMILNLFFQFPLIYLLIFCLAISVLQTLVYIKA